MKKHKAYFIIGGVVLAYFLYQYFTSGGGPIAAVYNAFGSTVGATPRTPANIVTPPANPAPNPVTTN